MEKIITPGSSGIVSIGYDEKRKILEITFIPSGTYHYMNVQHSMYKALLKAESKGSFVNKYIKGRYKYKRIR
jgi:hypothetical protein